MNLETFPALKLFTPPTPVHELPRLRTFIGCHPRIYVKRDDYTGVGLGGNKVRKLTYIMGRALAAGARTVITWGGVQSNHCRQTLALARQLGMDCHLILTGDEPDEAQGNLLIFRIMGAHLHFIGREGDAVSVAEKLAQELTAKKKPFIIPLGGSTPLGCLGYIEAAREIAQQALTMGVGFEHVFLATGSCGTQAGLEIGTREFIPRMKVHGISVSKKKTELQQVLADLVNETYHLLGMNNAVTPGELSVFDGYYGERYGVPTKAGLEAIKLLGRKEGLLLDPVYTGKAMAGLIDLLCRGKLDDADAVLFIHTGGFPATFSFASHLSEN